MRQILLVVHLIFYPFQGALFSMGKLHTLDFLTLEICQHFWSYICKVSSGMFPLCSSAIKGAIKELCNLYMTNFSDSTTRFNE